MTDKKLTDSEIVKAWEDEIHLAEYVDSGFCNGVSLSLVKSTLDLINCLQTENKRLQNTLDDVLDREPLLVERSEKYAKAEAYKEFWEELKKRAYCKYCKTGQFVLVEDGDNFLKELVGDNNAGN